MSKKDNLKIFKDKNTRGFTVLEALVAFSILVIAFGAFTSSMTTSIKAFKEAESHHLASEIAKEGMELLISKKDNHVRQKCRIEGVCSEWRENFADGSYEVSSSRPGDLLADVGLRSFDEGRYLCFMEGLNVEGKFGYCQGSDPDGDGKKIPGNFNRKIEINTVGGGEGYTDPDGVRLRSIVSWGGGSNEIVLESLLYTRELFVSE